MDFTSSSTKTLVSSREGGLKQANARFELGSQSVTEWSSAMVDREKDRRFNAQIPMSVLPVSAVSSSFVPLDRSRSRDHQGKRFCIVENR